MAPSFVEPLAYWKANFLITLRLPGISILDVDPEPQKNFKILKIFFVLLDQRTQFHLFPVISER